MIQQVRQEGCRYDYFKAILPSRKYLNDRSVDGRGIGGGEDRLERGKSEIVDGRGGLAEEEKESIEQTRFVVCNR